MVAGIVEGGIALVIAVAGGILLIGQIKENARKNEADIGTIKEMLHDYQESMFTLISKNMDDMKQLLDREKSNSREAWQNEIAHLRELVNINANETRADIQRLEAKQEKSNHIKERLVLAESSLKSLHKRLDIEPPVILRNEEED